jgi:cell division protein FtsZ
MIDLDLEEEVKSSSEHGATLRVIGIGGAGSNAVNSMLDSSDLQTIQFIVANTDAQALSVSSAPVKIQLGTKSTKGLGAGSNPEIGKKSAEEDLDSVLQYLIDTDILFLTAGLGGGTGSGAMPVIANAARELGILTVAVVTKPFAFEGKRRSKHANDAIEALRKTVDTLIVVPNQRLLEIADSKISMLDAFALSNSILKQAIKGISDIIAKPGHINVDFADVKAIMKDMGMAIMGTGRANGEGRARKAAEIAINSPLLENVSITGARGVLINIAGNKELKLQEISDAASLIYELANEEANIILGSVIDDSLGNEIEVTVIATGCVTACTSIQPAEKKAFEDNVVTSVNTEPEIIKSTEISCSKSINMLAELEAATQEQEDIKLEAVNAAEVFHTEEVIEEGQNPAADVALTSADNENFDNSNLDTPTFMRKKTEQNKGKENRR